MTINLVGSELVSWLFVTTPNKKDQTRSTKKMSSVPSMRWSFASLVKTGRDARKGPFFPLLQAIEGGGGRGGGELPTACSCCGQYGHRSRSGERTGRVIGDESEGGRGLAGFKQAAHHPSQQVDKIPMFHVPASDQGGLWGESGLHLVSSHRPLLLTFSRLCPLPSHEPSRKQPGTFLQLNFVIFSQSEALAQQVWAIHCHEKLTYDIFKATQCLLATPTGGRHIFRLSICFQSVISFAEKEKIYDERIEIGS